MKTDYTLLAGTIPSYTRALPPFSPLVLSFLQTLSQELLHSPLSAQNPSWGALAFWLRATHLNRMKQDVSFLNARLGRGLVFHIAPTNMPVMFAYSLAISMLAGNSNIVRLSPRIVQALTPLYGLFHNILSHDVFRPLYETNGIVTYDASCKALTDEFSTRCDGRIIWGGDHSINAIRQSPLSPRAVELVFADRYSIAVLNSHFISNCSDEELYQWTHRFYNDTYEIDQNACSSPKLIFWLNSTDTIDKQVQHRWWQAVAKESLAYDLQPIKVSEKYCDAWRFAMEIPEISTVDRVTNRLYVYTLSSLPSEITVLSGKFGQFFQSNITSLDDLMPYMTKKVQTISTIGISTDALRTQLITHGVAGTDRIVPVGQAMDMDIIWDGLNMIEALSRIIR